jgi:hypothetical protein
VIDRLTPEERIRLAQEARRLADRPGIPSKLKQGLRRSMYNLMQINMVEAKREHGSRLDRSDHGPLLNDRGFITSPCDPISSGRTDQSNKPKLPNLPGLNAPRLTEAQRTALIKKLWQLSRNKRVPGKKRLRFRLDASNLEKISRYEASRATDT